MRGADCQDGGAEGIGAEGIGTGAIRVPDACTPVISTSPVTSLAPSFRREAAEELTPDQLDMYDLDYPLLSGVRAAKSE